MYNKSNVIRHLEQRQCLSCGKIWELHVGKIRTSDRIQLFCPECNKKLTESQKINIRCEKDENFYEQLKERKRTSHKRNIIHNMWKRAKVRAEKYGYKFNIEEQDIIIPEVCPLLEIPIYCGDKDNYENSPSLDRIDNNKGYVKGNIQVISKKANSMKNSATTQELITFCTNILRYSLNNKKSELIEQENKESLG